MKKMKLAVAGLVVCFAANTYADGVVSMDNFGSITSGSGVGDMILAAVAGDRSRSLVWDLSAPGGLPGDASATDLTYADLTMWAAANPGGMFMINNATVGAEIDNTWSWHVFGYTNVTATFGSEIVDQGVATTVDNPGTLPTGGVLQTGMLNVAQWVGLNQAEGLTGDGVEVATASTDPHFWDNLDNGGDPLHGNNIFGIDPTGNVGDTLEVALLRLQPGFGTIGLPTTLDSIGTFSLDDTGKLTFVAAAIPVPPAIWLFGSAFIGLLGAARRK